MAITNMYNKEQRDIAAGDINKTLPDTFEDNNSKEWIFLAVSVVLHVVFAFAIWLTGIILMFLGITNPLANKPDLKNKDIEFVLTQNEEKPINKNTKYRSDKNSRAGGIHDPKKQVSMPSPSPAPTPQPVQKPAAPAQPVQPVQKPAQKPVQQKVAQQPAPPVPQKPTKAAAPVQRPVLKPSPSTPKPQIPKLATAPSSPFKVNVPKTSAPVGKGFSTGSGTANTGGTSGSTTSKGGSSSGMPAPQFSTTRTGTSGSGSRVAQGGTGRGGYGTGNMGNPGPGNPSGAPGIDAIKSPQWGPYMRELESKIKRNWHPPKGDQSKRVVLLFKIGRRGELLSTRVVKSSGSQANDQAAIQSVKLSAPFRALPPEFTGSSVEIEFTFDYNVLGASYRN